MSQLNEFNRSIIENVVRPMVETFRRKDLKKDILSGRIGRGYSPSSSSEFEEYLAKAIEPFLSPKFSILIDTPVYYNRKKFVRPDLLIIDRSEKCIHAIIECKIDLGFLDLKWIKINQDSLKSLREAKTINIGTNPLLAESKAGKGYTFSKQFESGFITVLSDANHGDKLSSFDMDSCCVLLSGLDHPNDRKHSVEDYVGSVECSILSQNQWYRLFRYVNNIQ